MAKLLVVDYSLDRTTGESYRAIASMAANGTDRVIHYRSAGFYVGNPDWSPDGGAIVFDEYQRTTGCEVPSCPMRIYSVGVSDGAVRQVVPDVPGEEPYWDHQPAWSRVATSGGGQR